jgi:hypothetical protein
LDRSTARNSDKIRKGIGKQTAFPYTDAPIVRSDGHFATTSSASPGTTPFNGVPGELELFPIEVIRKKL